MLSGLIALAPLVVTSGTLSAFGERPPALVRWIAPLDGIVEAIALAVLTLNPGVMGYRIKRTS